ncbi:MAG: nucleotidyltransferase [Acidobacteria bacterium]|nr:nucleotidyltransferase [Acidobacteriota bacterium]
MTQFDRALSALVTHGVHFVVIGAVAAVARGAAASTQDLDLCYERSPENLDRLVTALQPYHPRLRDVPQSIPFRFDVPTLGNGMNFTLATDLGDIDLFGELPGVGGFAQAAAGSTELELFGSRCAVASLDTIIASKRAAGRPKDLLALRELEALRELGEGK